MSKVLKEAKKIKEFKEVKEVKLAKEVKRSEKPKEGGGNTLLCFRPCCAYSEKPLILRVLLHTSLLITPTCLCILLTS